MSQSNPNGANQYLLDPRQKLCWELYSNPKEETFGNAYQSAQKAGYEESYSAQITLAPWFVEKLRRINLLSKAEKIMDKIVDMDAVNEEGRVDTGVLRVQADMAKFLASTQGKDEGYSTRTDINANVKTMNVVFDDSFNENT